jgi:hypothetical protein
MDFNRFCKCGGAYNDARPQEILQFGRDVE